MTTQHTIWTAPKTGQGNGVGKMFAWILKYLPLYFPDAPHIWGGVLRDEPKNSCEGDYWESSPHIFLTHGHFLFFLVNAFIMG